MNVTPQLYIVDDSADYRFIVQQVFQRFLPHYKVRFFADGSELRQLITDKLVASVPDLILLDFHMPQLNGLQTLAYVRQEVGWSHVPVVLMSSGSTTEEKAACYEAGANAIIDKPTDLGQLRQVLESTCYQWLESNRLSQQ